MENSLFLNATGNIDFNMTNDYMFRIILQENEMALRGLLCSLLRLQQEDIKSITILNPIKNHQVYNDKFVIGVVDLNGTDLATEEDKTYNLDDWVRLFKAKTWEELKMIAKDKPELLEASKSMYEYNADVDARYKCIAFEEYTQDMRRIKRLEEENARLKEQLAKLGVKPE